MADTFPRLSFFKQKVLAWNCREILVLIIHDVVQMLSFYLKICEVKKFLGNPHVFMVTG